MSLSSSPTSAQTSWSPRFKDIFDKAKLSLSDAANTVIVRGHVGPYPDAYHDAVFKRLTDAVDGLSGDEYGGALRKALQGLADEISTPGTAQNKLVTRR